MCGCLPRSVRGRAIIGVIALYALLLQVFLGFVFLGFATPVGASASPGSILCAEHAPDAPVGGTGHLHDHPCCTAAQAGYVALPPAGAARVAGPFTPMARIAWRPEAGILRTGPPVHAASARGPPAA